MKSYVVRLNRYQLFILRIAIEKELYNERNLFEKNYNKDSIKNIDDFYKKIELEKSIDEKEKLLNKLLFNED